MNYNEIAQTALNGAYLEKHIAELRICVTANKHSFSEEQITTIEKIIAKEEQELGVVRKLLILSTI